MLKEKEHEVYFLNMIREEKWLPLFEQVFNWGTTKSLNDLADPDTDQEVNSDAVCTTFKRGKSK